MPCPDRLCIFLYDPLDASTFVVHVHATYIRTHSNDTSVHLTLLHRSGLRVYIRVMSKARLCMSMKKHHRSEVVTLTTTFRFRRFFSSFLLDYFRRCMVGLRGGNALGHTVWKQRHLHLTQMTLSHKRRCRHTHTRRLRHRHTRAQRAQDVQTN